MAQGVPDASFQDGCNGSANSVGGFVADFLKFLDTSGATGCTVRDKFYKLSASTFANFDPNETFLQISQSTFNPLSHAIKLSNVSGFQPGIFNFNYTISVVLPSNLKISQWFASAEPADNDFSQYTLVTDTNFTPSTSIMYPAMASGPTVLIPGNQQSVDFTNELTVVDGFPGPNGFTNTVRQAPIETPPDSVPGPLPLLGAAAAFGFSRKLRARIKTMA
jgi:hypothetical protein